MRSFNFFSLGIALLSAATSLPVYADIIVSYAAFPYSDTDSGVRDSVAGDTTLTGVTGIDMTRGGGLQYTPTNNAFNSDNWAINLDGAPTVLNPNGYVEIGFSLDPGYSATLDELIIGTRSSTSGPSQIGVFASTDGFTTAIATIDEDSNFSNSIISLASIGTVTGDFRLRFLNVGGVTPASPSIPGEEDMDEDSTWRIISHFDSGTFTDPQITGVVAVPEPASLAALTFCGLAGMVRRRRRVS
ncbi:PEP-CTERM sorting domain-containing protein [Crateriforma conspicua]|uniref:Ice-binding protein C-terminal domain-containing protein n=1 Tax=Crateriforma conspicua TaxID=2527996 RepID=A0A5C5Y4W6_9PLAN|nr:PEP-CTERM sorting domain-containing protein [Crateriforma conspicua]QDV64351.1 hypothetical protein Mal65_35050 [Crateriforma conspicua]TWT69753.1 hypothetical protein Pan14r_20450 [Crateriforma conspicua]